MSITVKQAWAGVDLSLEQGSGSNSKSTATVTYIVEGTDSDLTACTSAYEFAPDEFSEIPKRTMALKVNHLPVTAVMKVMKPQ